MYVAPTTRTPSVTHTITIPCTSTASITFTGEKSTGDNDANTTNVSTGISNIYIVGSASTTSKYKGQIKTS